MNADDHDGLSCPECRAASETCKAIGGFAESLEKMLADGTFERLGEQMAREQEERILGVIMMPVGIGQPRPMAHGSSS